MRVCKKNADEYSGKGDAIGQHPDHGQQANGKQNQIQQDDLLISLRCRRNKLIHGEGGRGFPDDVAAIFTGKTWKLNYITVDGGHEMFGFWENEEQEKASIKELNKNGTYNIVFDGTVDGDVINGNIKGTVIATSTFEGKWNANAKNNSFKATVTTAGSYGDDKLAKNFIEGLNAATSYEGDSNNLYLLYKPASGKQTFRMVFRVVSSK